MAFVEYLEVTDKISYFYSVYDGIKFSCGVGKHGMGKLRNEENLIKKITLFGRIFFENVFVNKICFL